MLQTILSMPETIAHGPDTREWAISDKECPSLAAYHFRGVGMSTPGKGYQVVRHNPSFGHINVCLEGAGTIWANDRWDTFPAGKAAILPPKVPHGGTASGFWRMCWVIGDDRPGRTPKLRSCLRTIMSVRAGFWFKPLLSGRDPFSSPLFSLPRHSCGAAVNN